jgi:hypothetical protein
MSNNEAKIVEPPASKWAKYGPVIFWVTVIGLPVMNVTAAVFNYKSLKLQLEIERIKEIVGRTPDF